jgi:hypothetical protein
MIQHLRRYADIDALEEGKQCIDSDLACTPSAHHHKTLVRCSVLSNAPARCVPVEHGQLSAIRCSICTDAQSPCHGRPHSF